MKSLREEVISYLEMRRALGFKLKYAGTALFDFVSFMDQNNASHITTALAVEWSKQPQSVLPSMWAQRLCIVRVFARHLSAIDPRTEIPLNLIQYRPKRAKPYIYTEEEIQQILAEVVKLPGSDLKHQTYYCLLGLLSVSGMRISEAVELKKSNLDLTTGLLTIEGTKFGKSRLVPLHESTQRILSNYLAFSSKHTAGNDSEYLFISDSGRKLVSSTVNWNFNLLLKRIGLRALTARQGPRLHDFRHSFAIKTLQNWYRSGENVESQLPVLSTFLGHLNIAHTYWYLTACPELMGSAVTLLEQRWEVKYESKS